MDDLSIQNPQLTFGHFLNVSNIQTILLYSWHHQERSFEGFHLGSWCLNDKTKHYTNSVFPTVHHFAGLQSQNALNTNTLKHQMHKTVTFCHNNTHHINWQINSQVSSAAQLHYIQLALHMGDQNNLGFSSYIFRYHFQGVHVSNYQHQTVPQKHWNWKMSSLQFLHGCAMILSHPQLQFSKCSPVQPTRVWHKCSRLCHFWYPEFWFWQEHRVQCVKGSVHHGTQQCGLHNWQKNQDDDEMRYVQI